MNRPLPCTCTCTHLGGDKSVQHVVIQWGGQFNAVVAILSPSVIIKGPDHF